MQVGGGLPARQRMNIWGRPPRGVDGGKPLKENVPQNRGGATLLEGPGLLPGGPPAQRRDSKTDCRCCDDADKGDCADGNAGDCARGEARVVRRLRRLRRRCGCFLLALETATTVESVSFP